MNKLTEENSRRVFPLPSTNNVMVSITNPTSENPTSHVKESTLPMLTDGAEEPPVSIKTEPMDDVIGKRLNSCVCFHENLAQEFIMMHQFQILFRPNKANRKRWMFLSPMKVCEQKTSEICHMLRVLLHENFTQEL